ncbi:ABC transporter permease [Actinoplanes rectilineatus]|uniref:ABC transporter permease n=1 Tax=Actinoplanes rectilineatus TaxID=113571 RepID=UPI0005F2BC23|nr:FtsX-like permease family protein [Actinoplanes rectilineatus]
MALIIRRAVAAKGLLAAALAVMVIAVLLLAALTAYTRSSGAAGVRAAIAAAGPQDRSVLVRGAGGSDPQARDRAVRDVFRSTFDDVTVSGASYGSGWALSGPAGDAVPDDDGVVYADVVALENLAAHATLVSGRWPAADRQTALAEPVAATLGVTAGDTLRLADRRTGKVVAFTVSGVWRPAALTDPYWLLVPDVFAGRAAQTSTYGPIVVGADTFAKRFTAGASAGWLAEPDLDGAGLARVTRTSASASLIVEGLPESTGLGNSATVTTGLGELAGRLDRADLVRRSTMVTPILLIVVLGGYALSLVALLLGEARRAETALLRARGASRVQLGRLAAVEGLAMLLPAGLVAPPLAVFLLGLVPFPAGLTVEPRLDASVWLTAGLAVAGGVLALTLPAVRKGRTYIAETSGRSRLPMLRRAGLDLVVVVLAVLAWMQLRQYSSPVGAGLGIDPLLAAAPILGVLTGAVVAIRLLPPVARLAGARLGRGTTRAWLLGTWQAGRRAQAGPMVLLALAVAAATVSWCLTGTAERSIGDQAVQQVGADVRLVEAAGSAPAGRAAQIAALPGAGQVVPAWRESLTMSAGRDPAELIALDTAAAQGVVQARDDAFGRSPAALLGEVAAQRGTVTTGTLAAGTIRSDRPVHTTAVLTGGRRIDLGVSDAGRPVRFDAGGAGLLGFVAETSPDVEASWLITGQGRDWRALAQGSSTSIAALDKGIRVRGRVAVTREPGRTAVPLVVTPDVLTVLNAEVGEHTLLGLPGGTVQAIVVATVSRVPGTAGGSALLADRVALDARLFENFGVAYGNEEWWVSGEPRGMGELTGLQVLDQRDIAAAAGRDPFGAGARFALFGAALGAVLLAAAGIAADARATARRRAVELSVMHTLGAGPGLLARSLVVEQAFLAGLGALAGLGVGLLVAGAMAPLLVLTPAAARPVPEPVLAVGWLPTIGSAVLLVLIALGLSALSASAAARRLPASRLRLGADR